MRIKTQDYNNITVVEMQGELDGDFAEQFSDTISDCITGNKSGIVLDMRAVGFIDSKGLEQLLWARDYCNQSKRGIRIAGLDENCAKILEVTRLDKEFDCYAELSEAVKSFA